MTIIEVMARGDELTWRRKAQGEARLKVEVFSSVVLTRRCAFSIELLLFLFMGLTVAMFCPSHAHASVAKLMVVKPTATVYAGPDFDAEVIFQLPAKRQVYGTKKTFVGATGLGLFHKVRLRQGVYGYVLDTDVKVLETQDSKSSSSKKKVLKKGKTSSASKGARLKAKPKSQAKSAAARAKPKPKVKEPKATEKPTSGFQISQPQNLGPQNLVPFFFRSYVGLNLGMVDYSEKIADGTKSSQEWMAGLKLTGPNWIFKNFLLDINLNVHIGAPQFFEDFSSEASGFLVQADVTMPFMLKPLSHGALYGGFGPLVSASSYKFNYLGQNRDSQTVRVGAVIMLGLGYEFGGFAFRLEPKYYWEKTRYFGVLAGIQKRL